MPVSIQRKVGFEYETGAPALTTTNGPLTPAEESGLVQLPTDDGAARHGGGNIHHLAKSDILVDNATYKVTAEEPGGGLDWSTVELVVKEQEENAQGRGRLIASLNALADVVADIQSRTASAAMTIAAAGPGGAVPDPNRFVINMGMNSGDPQMTAGVGLSRIATMMEAVGQPAGLAAQPPVQRLDLGGQRADDFRTVGVAPAAARHAIGAYLPGVPARTGNPAPFNANYDELIGLLSLIGSYLKTGERAHQYAKGIAPLMARNNFATIFAKLAAPVRVFFDANNQDEWVRLGAQLLNSLGIAGGLDANVFAGGVDIGIDPDDLTRRMWLRGMPQGHDYLSRNEWPTAADRPFIMGMGALPGVGEAVGAGGPAPNIAPILEFRRMRKSMTFAEFADVALGAFDYVVRVNAIQPQQYSPHARTAQEQATGRLV